MRKKNESMELVFEDNSDLRRIVMLMGDKNIEITASIRPPAPAEFWQVKLAVEHANTLREIGVEKHRRILGELVPQYVAAARQLRILPFTWLLFEYDLGNGCAEIKHHRPQSFGRDDPVWEIKQEAQHPLYLLKGKLQYNTIRFNGARTPRQVRAVKETIMALPEHEVYMLSVHIGRRVRGEYTDYSASLFGDKGKLRLHWEVTEEHGEPEILSSLLALGFSFGD